MARAQLEFPERLVDTKSRASAVIQRALDEPAHRASERQGWRRLRERSRRSRARWVWLMMAFGLLGAALPRLWHEPSADTELKAEVWQSRPAAAPQGSQQSPAAGRNADLILLRAELLTTRGDCKAALEAAQKAREAGTDASRLESVERRCHSASPTPSRAR